MDATARRCRGRADEDVRRWCGIGDGPDGWPKDHLPEGCLAAIEVSADQVGIMLFEGGWSHRVPGDNPIAEAGREPLDLGLDSIGHIYGASVWHVAVAPGGVLAVRGSGRI